MSERDVGVRRIGVQASLVGKDMQRFYAFVGTLRERFDTALDTFDEQTYAATEGRAATGTTGI